LKVEAAAPSHLLIHVQPIDAEEETAMRLKKLRVRSLLWLALSGLILILVGVALCLEVLGASYPAIFLAASFPR
jgi:hypothetical protein